MNKKTIQQVLLAVLAPVFMLSCKSNPEAPQNPPVLNTESVEKNAPNTDFKPAITGQTRIAKVTTQTQLQTDLLAENIGKPWAIINLPDGRLLVTDKTGFMQIFSATGALEKKITGFPTVDSRGQGGMLDVALDPAFNTNKTIYWSYSEPKDGKNLTAVAKGRLAPDESSVQSVTVIFRATPYFESTLHFGSRLVFDKEGYLYVSTGERSDLPGRVQAQQLNSGLGKIFRITQDGAPAPGGAFAQTPDAMPGLYSYGHRNVQGMDLHPATGELYAIEFGPRGGDEVNLVKPGKNYGWPVITYGIEYGGQKIGDAIQQKDGMEQPMYYWDPVISPSGMAFYRGTAISEWKNDLFIAALSGQHICRLVIKEGKVTGEERLLEDKRERFRDVLSGTDGALYAITDSGKIFRVMKK